MSENSQLPVLVSQLQNTDLVDSSSFSPVQQAQVAEIAAGVNLDDS